MREMGEASAVPIEPAEQTKLLDVCVSQAGVIGGGIPGGKLVATLKTFRSSNYATLQLAAMMLCGYWLRIR
jgi:phosphomevalonate kinase